MTDDTTLANKLLLVQNRAGVSYPFSRETLATSLQVSGILPPQAFLIAAEVEAGLHREGAVEVDSSQLAERAAIALATHSGAAAAERFRAWRRFRHLGRPLVLCLLGARGVGKSTQATGLAPQLGIHRTVPTEAVREVLRTVVPSTMLPELHVAAHDAAAMPTGVLAGGFLGQAEAVGHAATAVAAGAVAEGRNVMLVGAHLVPGRTRAQLAARGSTAMVVELLLTLDDEREHRLRMLRRLRSEPGMPGVRHLQNFRAVRLLQEELRRLARAGGVVSHDLAGRTNLTEWIVDHVVAAAHVA
jgi:2-phosphoglycerate kinase